jgi:polyhydroxyalkanoate synthesis regulator phasin
MIDLVQKLRADTKAVLIDFERQIRELRYALQDQRREADELRSRLDLLEPRTYAIEKSN